MNKSKNICTARFDSTDPYYNQNTIIPVQNHKGIKATRKRLRFKYRWLKDDTIFEIHIDGNWKEAQSIDFEFN